MLRRRARDLLIVPKAGSVQAGRFVCGDFLADVPTHLIQTTDAYVAGAEPRWSCQLKAVERKEPADGTEVGKRVRGEWEKASAEAAPARFCPASVSALARVSPREEGEDAVEALPLKDRDGRYGGLFGSTVHYAIGLMLRSSDVNAGEAVHRAARLYALTEHLEEAAADVTRGLKALNAAGLARSPESDLRLEYPVAGRWTDGQLASGYIDLVSSKTIGSTRFQNRHTAHWRG